MDPAAVAAAYRRIIARSERDVAGPVVRGRRCLLFTGACSGNGYRYVNVDDRSVGAHRVVFTHRHGPIPAGHVVMHACDVPACMEDRHHILGTTATNNADMVAKARQQRGERHYNARLTEAQVVELRRRAAEGEHRSALAEAFGITPKTVKAIVARARWAHVA